jgi:hypothetical protein
MILGVFLALFSFSRSIEFRERPLDHHLDVHHRDVIDVRNNKFDDPCQFQNNLPECFRKKEYEERKLRKQNTEMKCRQEANEEYIRCIDRQLEPHIYR